MRRCMGCMLEYDEQFDVCPHCGWVDGAAAWASNHLSPGTVIDGRYMLGKALGQGGFGITYIAWAQRIGKSVAIKEYMPGSFASRAPGTTGVSCYNAQAQSYFDVGLKKVLDESRCLGRFNDLDGVVNVLDCFEENNTAYIVMELLRGRTLKEYLSEKGALSYAETVEIISPVLSALDEIHKTGLIHRDIAPDNIFMCDNGKIKLIDFGSARVESGSNDKSLSVILKPGYAPTEQYSSRAKQGSWTDIYAVSATIYKMLTGITPIDGLEREIDKTLELQPISSVTQIPPSAEKAIMKGMAIKAEDRIRTAGEMLQILTDAVKITQPKPKQERKEPVPVAKVSKPAQKMNDDKTVPIQAAKITPPVRPASTDSASAPQKVRVAADKVAPSPIKQRLKEKASDIKLPLAFIAIMLVVSLSILAVVYFFGNGSEKNTSIIDDNASIIELGAYPQTEITDDELVSSLNDLQLDWVSYGYYIEGAESDFMEYADVTYKGDKYRAVRFFTHRPRLTGADSSNYVDNGYETDTIYWFKYEPLKWRVLDAEKRIVVSETVVDSQGFNYEYTDITWENCSLREWLNGSFYDTAFSPEEQVRIKTSFLVNEDSPYGDAIGGNDTRDKVFLLSYSDWSSYDDNNNWCPQASDYALCQGVGSYSDDASNGYNWWIRRPGDSSYNACNVSSGGYVDYYCYVTRTDIGVRPALQLNP